MKLALLAPLVLVSSLASSAAFAQAPGDYNGGGYSGGYGGGYGGYGGYGAGPSMSPYAPPAPPPPPPVRRFSIGVGFGHLNLAPHNAPDMSTDFGLGTIAVRYLLGRHLELELQLAGGDANTSADAYTSNVSIFEGVLGARWRFSPQQRWNWWLMAGMGTLTVAPSDASSEQRKALEQSTLQFGLGLERRWTRFALQAELRAVGVKKNDGGDTTVAVPPGMGPQPYPPNVGNPGMSGGQFALSGNYYF